MTISFEMLEDTEWILNEYWPKKKKRKKSPQIKPNKNTENAQTNKDWAKGLWESKTKAKQLSKKKTVQQRKSAENKVQ